jgi:DNA-binding FadR family transcriptional regulator
LLRTSFELSTAKKDGPLSSLPLHRAVLDAVASHNPVLAEQAICRLIDSAHTDIEEILTTRRRLPRVNRPASELKAA